eukprot:3657170-Amphidinium_carterae.1
MSTDMDSKNSPNIYDYTTAPIARASTLRARAFWNTVSIVWDHRLASADIFSRIVYERADRASNCFKPVFLADLVLDECSFTAVVAAAAQTYI